MKKKKSKPKKQVNNTIIRITAIILVAAIYLIANSSKPSPTITPTIFGVDCSISVKQPKNWYLDYELADKQKALAMFYKNTQADLFKNQDEPPAKGILITLDFFNKNGGSTEKWIKSNADNFKKSVSGLKVYNFSAEHKSYKSISKLFYRKDLVSIYLTYLDPGPEYAFFISISLKVPYREATDGELKAFRYIVSTTKVVLLDK